MRLFLTGGGREPAASALAHAPFVRAAEGRPVVAYVLAEPGGRADLDRWVGQLTDAGAAEVRPVTISEHRGPRADDLEGAGGVYIAGGWTPGYREAVAAGGMAWLDVLRREDLPYGGFSAGAAIAAHEAIVGGWRATTEGGQDVAVCPEDAGEDLRDLTLRAGLSLVDCLIDVHATQWGTLPRLMAALDMADADEGFAIDEGTTLAFDGAAATVHGSGVVYRVRLAGGDRMVTAHVDGDRIEL